MSFAGASGHFELNVYNPVMAYTLLQSIRLLGDAALSFTEHCVVGIEPRIDNIKAALKPLADAGDLRSRPRSATRRRRQDRQDRAPQWDHPAHAEGPSAAAYVTEAEFDAFIVRPENMIGPG